MAELEEFQESEIIFSDDDDGANSGAVEADIFHVPSKHGRLIGNSATVAKKKKIHVANSVPVNIPSDTVFRFEDGYEYDDEDGEIVPPHVIVGRRVSGGKMAYSVSSGNGRTLKGRDLSRVRNSILRLTGFLET